MVAQVKSKQPRPLIATAAKRAKLAQAFAGWIGTPFIPHASVPGAGVDCVHLAHSILNECGARLPQIRTAYEIDRASHTDHSLLVNWIEAHPHKFQRVEEMQPGDVLGIRIERCIHHTGIVLDERLFGHVVRGYRVTRTLLRMIPRYGKLEHIWRPLK